MRVILLSAFFFFTLSLSAQYDKGNWYLNTDSRIGDASPNRPTNSGAGLLGGGYFIADRFLLGLTTENLTSFDEGNSRMGVYGRYYFPVKDSRLSFFTEAGLNYNFDARVQLGYHVAAGLEYELAPGVMLTGSAGYRFGERTDRMILDLGLNVILGKSYRSQDGPNFLNARGDLLISGDIADLSFARFRGKDLSVFGDVSLTSGYFLNRALYLEAGLAYSGSRFRIGSEALPRDFWARSVNAEASVRYFLLPGRRFQPYLGAGLSYDNTWRERTDNQMVFSRTETLANVQAGFLHHFNERVALDFNLRLNRNFDGAASTFLSGGLGLKVRLKRD